MENNPVNKRVRLPFRLAEKLSQEARRRQCSVSQVVARAILRDLAGAVEGFRSGDRSARASVEITNEAGPALAGKAALFAELIGGHLRKSGLVPAPADDLRAEFKVTVAMHDLNCQLPPKPAPEISQLRVNATLCVVYRVFDARSGAEFAGRSLAVSRLTAPIVAGTTVGGNALDCLLDEAASTIVQEISALPLAH